MLDRAAWHELKLDGRRRRLQGVARRPARRSNTRSAARRARAATAPPPNPDLFPENNPVLRPPVAGTRRPVGQDRQHQLLQGLRRQLRSRSTCEEDRLATCALDSLRPALGLWPRRSPAAAAAAQSPNNAGDRRRSSPTRPARSSRTRRSRSPTTRPAPSARRCPAPTAARRSRRCR